MSKNEMLNCEGIEYNAANIQSGLFHGIKKTRDIMGRSIIYGVPEIILSHSMNCFLSDTLLFNIK